jgi:radical SAM protein with 4Fe4S-binding SPASM domain
LQGLDAQSYKKTCGVAIDFERFYKNLKLLYEYKNDNTNIYIKIIDTALNTGAEEQRFYEMFSPIADSVFVEKEVATWNQLDDNHSQNLGNKFGDSFGAVKYCVKLFYTLVVAPDGTILPCPQIPPPFSLGNIKETTLRDAWESEERTAFLRMHLQNGIAGHPRCKNCFFPSSSIIVKEDIIDPSAGEILKRLDIKIKKLKETRR